MLPIYERIGSLCKLNGTSINKMMIAIAPEDAKSPRDMYNGWRRRNTYPRADEAVKIANYLGVSVEYLVTGNDSDDGRDFYCKYKNYENLLAYFPKLNNSDLKVIENALKSMSK
jgi:hypothetical protein